MTRRRRSNLLRFSSSGSCAESRQRTFEQLEQRLCMAAMPNILVINTDDQRFDTLPYMPTVPSQLVPASSVFTNSFVPTPICSPSRASLLTGLYAYNHGVLHVLEPWGGFQNFNDSSTLATWLDGAGYNTAMIGKYINGYDVNAYANQNPNDTYVPPGWDQWRAMLGASFNSPKFSIDGVTQQFPGKYTTDVMSDMAVDFIESTSADGQAPFFLYYAPHNPHQPSLVAPRHQGAYDGIAPHRPPSFNEADISDKPNWVKNQLGLMTPAEIAALDEFREDQLESMLSVDEGIARMLDALRQNGQLENTIIIYTSDNGQHWGEHRFDEKGPAWEESIRVPLLIYDGRDPMGQTIDEMALNIDLAPTIMQLAGISLPQSADGRSLVPLMNNQNVDWRDDFLIERYIGDGGLYYGLRTERYTYTEYVYTNSFELYDNLNDPYQLTSQHNNPAYAGVRSQLAARLQQLRASDRTGPTTTNLSAAVSPSGVVTLTARVSDASTGGSEVRNAEYFVNSVGNNGLGKAMRVADGLYNSVAENMVVEISGLSPGLHTIYVHGRDISGNWGPVASIQVNTSLSSAPLLASMTALNFGDVVVGQTAARLLTFTNGAAAGGASIRIDPSQVTMSPLSAPFRSSALNSPPVTLAPGQSVTIEVVYAPTVVRADNATVRIPHSGSNTPLTISLSGAGVAAQSDVVHRVNAGGPQIAALPNWSADTASIPSFNNAATGGNSATLSTTAAIDLTHPSVPTGTPMAIFQSERYDKPSGQNLLWDFPVAAGQYEVFLYFAETYAGAMTPGARVFDVAIEGSVVLNDYDVFADVGGNRGVVKSFLVTSDANLDIDFLRVTQNPSVRAIEIRRETSISTVAMFSAFAPFAASEPVIAAQSTGSASQTSTTPLAPLARLGREGLPLAGAIASATGRTKLVDALLREEALAQFSSRPEQLQRLLPNGDSEFRTGRDSTRADRGLAPSPSTPKVVPPAAELCDSAFANW
jgi:N-acetylglucosamine-6-sulfatase